MKKNILFLVLLTFTFSNAKSFDIPAEYEQAVALTQKATEELKLGNVKSGDSLIKLSIKTYPVIDVFYYAVEMLNHSDLNGANVIMLLAVERMKNFPSKTLYIRGQQKIDISYREDAEFIFTMNYYKINQQYGNVEQKKKSAAIFVKAPVINGVFKKYYKTLQQEAEFHQAVFAEDIDAGIAALDKMDANKSDYNTMLAAMYLECRQYEKALSTAKEIKDSNPYLFYMIYAAMGNLQEAEHYIEEIKKIDKDFANNPTAPQPQLDYYTALLELNKKEYQAAEKKLSPYIRSSADQVVLASGVQVWKMHTAMGDALAGLKEYEKAKEKYTIALLYNPNYSSAKTGLDELEKIFAENLTTDKISPVVVITEPSPNRGLEVVSSLANVMVKGEATDLSGIKEVTINGIKVFAQTSGAFWGDVPMKPGINTISVVAVDMAGNQTEKSFEIKKTEPLPSNGDIPVAIVEEKEGKNYCVLIASQNYVDTSIPSLENPISDAVKLKIVLKSKYNFEDKNIISLFNPSSNDIKRQLIELTNSIEPQDNLLIFYAGHGIWVEKEKKGYWLMTDAVYKDVNTWTPNKEILDLISKLPSRHTLLITDACFSGSVFKTRGIPGQAPSAVKELDSKISRVAITSGNDTEVPDESVFMKYLVKALSQNTEPYLTAQKMFINQILEAVMTETKTEPRYGTLELAGHVGGDYIFTKK